MIETKDNKLGIFMAVSKNWPKEQREAYLNKLREEINANKRENTA